MSVPTALPPSAFWDFSGRIYARAGVAAACLALQDRHGLDVNVLLFCLWAGANGLRLAPARIEDAMAATREWQDAVVTPLRGIRRRLKQDVHAVGNDHRTAIRSQIAAAELAAEHVEQLTLERLLDATAGETPGTAEDAAVNLAIYGAAAAIAWTSQDEQALATLIGGVFPNVSAGECARLGTAIRAGNV